VPVVVLEAREASLRQGHGPVGAQLCGRSGGTLGRAGRGRNLLGGAGKRLIDPAVDEQVPRGEPVQGETSDYREGQRDHRRAAGVPADGSSEGRSGLHLVLLHPSNRCPACRRSVTSRPVYVLHEKYASAPRTGALRDAVGLLDPLDATDA